MRSEKRNYLRSFVFITTGLIIQSADAGTMGNILPSHRYLATLSAGVLWQNAGKEQTFFLAPEIEKTYTADKKSRALGEIDLFLARQQPISGAILGQFGLAIGASSNAKLTGAIWDDADPQFNNYVYDYNVQHNYLDLKAKFLADMGAFVTPWVSAAAGIALNHALGFSNTPVIFEAIPNRNFTSHYRSSFTYAIGAGIQKDIAPNWNIGLGYEFSDWGKSQLGAAREQTLNSGLTLDHLYTNGVLLQLTYLA